MVEYILYVHLLILNPTRGIFDVNKLFHKFFLKFATLLSRILNTYLLFQRNKDTDLTSPYTKARYLDITEMELKNQIRKTIGG